MVRSCVEALSKEVRKVYKTPLPRAVKRRLRFTRPLLRTSRESLHISGNLLNGECDVPCDWFLNAPPMLEGRRK
jgi:hypothetical protein